VSGWGGSLFTYSPIVSLSPFFSSNPPSRRRHFEKMASFGPDHMLCGIHTLKSRMGAESVWLTQPDKTEAR